MPYATILLIVCCAVFYYRIGEPKATADQNLHIEWPWRMTWMEYVDEMLAFLKSQIGPGHPLYRKKLYVSAVNKDADAWYIEGEKEKLYAIIYFSQKQRYEGKFMPKCEILPDWTAVLQRFAADHEKAVSKQNLEDEFVGSVKAPEVEKLLRH
jgi:hypothetical protein